MYLKLMECTQATLDNLVSMRRSQVGWVQRFVILALFLLICSPVVAKYLCESTGDMPSDVCTTR